MAEETSGPFRQVQSEYVKRLVLAATCIAVATVSGRLLFEGTTSHWAVALVALCVSASVGAIVSIDVIQRFTQMRRQKIVVEAPKIYGYAGPEPTTSAAEKLKRTRKLTPKDVH